MTRITGKPGCITSLAGFDDISEIPNGTYALVDNATGTGGTVTMSGGAIASFTPGYNYSLGDVYAQGYGNRFNVISIAPSGTRIAGGLRITAASAPASAGVTITIPDLTYVTSSYVNFSDDTYNNSGGWEYVVFNSTALYNQFQTLTSGANVPLAVTWSTGGTQTSGYVFFENTGNPWEFQFCTVTDSSGSTPQAGVFKFPATFTAI